MLRKAKLASLRLSRRLGLFSRIRDSRWRSQRLLILCYHGISIADEHEWNPALYMSPTVFRSRLAALRRGRYNVLPLGEAVDRLYCGELPPRAVVMTFDDGTYDFYREAFPLLQECGYPATVYLTTYYAILNRPVFPVMCSYILWKGQGRSLDGMDIFLRSEALDLITPTDRRAAQALIQDRVTADRLTACEKDQLLVTLAERLGVDYQDLVARRLLHIMNSREVAELSGAGVDVQLHTHRHRVPAHRELFRSEIGDNERIIRQITGSAPVHFCYPNGHYEPSFLPWLGELGIASAVTTEPGIASRHSPQLLLPRFVDSSRVSPIEFESWLSGAGSLLPRRRSPKLAVPPASAEAPRTTTRPARTATGSTYRRLATPSP
jgi:peptidoglycan/xylan/chitin deacetylase (PgdA/CDA1 family)